MSGNTLCGDSPVRGLYVSTGMSGHGFMFGPAIGKLMAEQMVKGRASIPLDEFFLSRSSGKAEALK